MIPAVKCTFILNTKKVGSNQPPPPWAEEEEVIFKESLQSYIVEFHSKNKKVTP